MCFIVIHKSRHRFIVVVVAASVNQRSLLFWFLSFVSRWLQKQRTDDENDTTTKNARMKKHAVGQRQKNDANTQNTRDRTYLIGENWFFPIVVAAIKLLHHNRTNHNLPLHARTVCRLFAMSIHILSTLLFLLLRFLFFIVRKCFSGLKIERSARK